MTNTKTTRLAILLLLALPFLSTGCLKCDILLELSPDGSGSLESTYSVTESATAQLKAMLKLSQQLGQISTGVQADPKDPEMMIFLDPNEGRIRKKLAKYKKYGLTLDKLRIKSRNARHTVDIKLKFEDIAKVAQADFFSDIGFSLYRRKSGDLVFFRHNLNAGNPNKELLASTDAQEMIAPILEGFDVNVKVLTPGRVLDSNAHTRSVRSATWSFDQDKDPSAFQKLQSQEYIILIESTGITIPDIRIVTEKKKEAAQ